MDSIANVKVAIICSPSATLLEQVLPVAVAMRTQDSSTEFLCIFPRPGSIHWNRKSWTTIRVFNELGARAAYPLSPSLWIEQDGLIVRGPNSKSLRDLSQLAFSLQSQCRPKALLAVEILIAILALLVLGRIPKIIDRLTRNLGTVLWDSTSVGREFMAPLHPFLSRVKGFSWYHGPGRYKSVSVTEDLKESILRKNTTIYCHSLQEVNQYHQTLGVPLGRIKTVGITRHHPDWIEALRSFEPESEATETKSTLLIISRQEKVERIPPDRKLQYLRDIRDVSEQLELHIKVKPHPKETNLNQYYEVFGPEGSGNRWSVTDKQITLLAQETMFAVCFRSYACLDLTVMGVPTIERLNLIGLPGYDNESSFRDDSGAPILKIRRDGHVLGASTSEEFFSRVKELVTNYDASVRSLQDAYHAYYFLPITNPKKIATEIIRVGL